MQQIFLFFTMLITTSEAFLNGSQISTSNRRKISGFVPNARIFKFVNPVFASMDFPVKIDTEPGTKSSREGSTFLSLFARHKRFSNDDRISSLKELGNVSFLRNRKFLNRRRNSSRRLRSMRKKRKLTPSFLTTKTFNVSREPYPASENSSVPSVISLIDTPVNPNKFFGQASYPKSRSKIVKKKQIKDSHYLPFKMKDFKRCQRIESRNIKKYKRDAEAVNVNQENVTKVEEKNLDEESNDSLDDFYPQDFRPMFATQFIDNTPPNWQKYLELNGQPVSPYLLPSAPDDDDYYDSVLNIPPRCVFVPRMNFQVPHDHKIHEYMNFEDDNSDAKFFRKSEVENVIEKEKPKKKKKKKDREFDTVHLVKFKNLLDDVENALKEEKGNTILKKVRWGGRGSGIPGGASEDTIRAKIEVVIPLLSQISQELRVRSTQLQMNTPDEEEEEEKEVKLRNKKGSDCNLDGIWISPVMGLEINVSTQPNLILKVAKKSIKEGALINNSWFMHGLSLAKTKGPFMLAAIYPGKKMIASFIGQCWIYKEKEYVYGSWTIFKREEKITDLLKAIDTKLDIFTRKKSTDEVT